MSAPLENADAIPSDVPRAGDILSGDRRFKRVPYAPPEIGSLYSVRDKAKGERIILVVGMSADGSAVQVETLDEGQPSKQPLRLAVDSLARQAEKGWCSRLLPVAESEVVRDDAGSPATEDDTANALLRLDIQNFSRCCGDIIRANIKFSTQLIKDVGDGPFRAGDYDQAFRTFEQLTIGFNSAVTHSRRAIAEGRRTLIAEKGKLSGREIQQRTTAFTRSEQLIHTAEREFSNILEGLRMYLRAQQG